MDCNAERALRAGSHWLAQGRGSQPWSQGVGTPAVACCPQCCRWQPARWPSSETDSCPAELLLCSLLPCPTQGLVSPLRLQQRCQPAPCGGTERPPQGREREALSPALLCTPSALGWSRPQGRVAKPSSRQRIQAPHRGLSTRHPGPRRECQADKGGALLNRHLLISWGTACCTERRPPAAGRSQGQSPGWHRAPPQAPKLTALLFLPGPPIPLPSRVWFWFYSHSYLFNKENSAVLRGKNPPRHAKMPHFHLMLSILSLSLLKLEMKDFFPCSPALP